MDTNTVKILESFGNKMDNYLSVIASKLGVATDHFYPIFVKQQMVEGCCNIVILIIAIIGSICLFKIGIHAYNRNQNEWDGNKIPIVMAVFLSILIILSVLFSGADFVGRIVNPEYYAIQSILSNVK